MSAINEFPWQETLLLALRGGRSASAEEIAKSAGSDYDERELESIRAGIEHLAQLGLARVEDGTASLTDEGEQAAQRLP